MLHYTASPKKKQLLGLFLWGQPVQGTIAEVQEYIHAYHDGINNVKYAYVINCVRGYLGSYTTTIPKKDKKQEKYALSPGGAGLI